MSLPEPWQAVLGGLIQGAGSLEGEFFRSVEIRYAHPSKVISGEGTRLQGGRFARPGVRALYVAADEVTALQEVTARKQRLGGQQQIPLTNYPRVTYVIRVRLSLHVNLANPAVRSHPMVQACLDTDLMISQEVGGFVRLRGAQGIIYPSAVPGSTGTNLIVFLDVSPESAVELVNRDLVNRLIREWAQQE